MAVPAVLEAVLLCPSRGEEAAQQEWLKWELESERAQIKTAFPAALPFLV